MLKPIALAPGDRIAVVAPASPFRRDDFERGILELRTLGFEPVFDDRVFERRGYVAGEAAVRARAIADAWRDDTVAGVMVARGGYGSVQVLPYLDVALARRARKPLVGYSDITSVLSFLTVQCGLACFHGPSVAGCLGRGEGGYDRETLVRALTSLDPLGSLQHDGLEALECGEAEGLLVGGTLTQLVASLGTPFAFDPPQGHVLLIDEVGERPYRLDRMLTQLAFAGILARASAIVFGQLPGCDEPGGGPTARDTVADILRGFPGPVLFGLRTGHTTGPAITVPLGVGARVVATGKTALVIDEPAVEGRP
jgi:muramoyltetrapeptide carboxypeptidase